VDGPEGSVVAYVAPDRLAIAKAEFDVMVRDGTYFCAVLSRTCSVSYSDKLGKRSDEISLIRS
jgi:hypothetical protein